MPRRISGPLLWPAIALALIAGLLRDASGAIILDQSFESRAAFTFTSVFIGGGQIDLAQTFTVGIYGTLARVEVHVGRSGAALLPLDIEIRSTTGGVPNAGDSAVLASASIAPEDVLVFAPPGPFDPFGLSWIGVDVLGADLLVLPGQMLAVTLHSEAAPGYYGWTGSSGYQGGQAFFRTNDPGTDPFNPISVDQFFRTFVIPASEPSTFILVALAILASVACRARKESCNGQTVGRHPASQ